MGYRISRYFMGLIVAACFMKQSSAQSGLCPSNLDFEQGDFSGWECFTWGLNPITPPVPGAVPGRHTMIDVNNASIDPFGSFPTLCPNGSGYSVKLGNQINGSQAESISFTYTIPATATNFSMLFYYAVVLENPSGHPLQNQPRFQARIVDVTTGIPVPCVDFDFISSTAPGGFRLSPIPGNLGDPVLYKDWTSVSINLEEYIGRTIKLEFITRDCAQNGHAGYAYIDVFTACNGAIQGTICQGDPSITLTAPFGYATYRWYSAPGTPFPEPPIATTQSITLTPPPPVGSILPVIVGPFPGFGCDDTLYAVVTESPKPPKSAGPDKVTCNGTQVQIGGPPLVAHNYSWTPVGIVSNPIISNPWAGPVTNPTEVYLEVTDLLTGCKSLDTTIVSNYIVDTAVTLTGDMDFCIGEPGGTFSVNSSSTNIQWHEATLGSIAGATGLTYSPTATGIYWVEMTQNGCPDRSGDHNFFIRPLPIAAFTPDNDSGCIARSTITFTNGSSTPDNSVLTHLWKFSDGVTDNNTHSIRMFPSAGTYNVKLVTTTEHGCKDSTAQDVFVLPLGVPDFTWDSICTTRPVQFTNLSDEANSPQTWYSWNFGNGDPEVITKTPPMVIYNDPPGKVDVILKLVSLGCETDTQTVVKTVQVNKQDPGHRYRTVTVPQGSTHWMHVRDTIGAIYNWRPQLYLSSYDKQYTQFTASGDDIDYRIDITDEHTCITTDSIQILVLKKQGYYLPTAFTPNGDGLNDIIRPYLVGMKGLKNFSIYNRGGQLIFFSKTEGQGWDGTFKGEAQNTGVYVWVLEFYDANNKLVMEKGTLTLIR